MTTFELPPIGIFTLLTLEGIELYALQVAYGDPRRPKRPLYVNAFLVLDISVGTLDE